MGAIINGDKIDQRVPTLVSTYEKPLSNCGGTEEKKEGLLWTFIFGLLGGFIALLTPCVFPMLPITVSFFTKDTKRKGWVNGLIYGVSIIVIYVLIGLLITIFVGPEALNRLSTNWIANTLFFLIFIAFAFSFFGYYEMWEYAARGGHKRPKDISMVTAYAGSNDIGKVAWYSSNSRSKTHPVGTKSPNELGLYDMSGNVWEWCCDWYDGDYYRVSPINNPQGMLIGSRRVLRGGSWGNQAKLCRTTVRDNGIPNLQRYFTGFRVVVAP